MSIVRRTELPDRSGWMLTVDLAGRAGTMAEVARAWRDDPAFAERWNDALADLPGVAFRWEVPGVTLGSAGRPFECVALDAPGLDRDPDPSSFAGPLDRHPGVPIVAFPNLSGDATLIVPRPIGPMNSYGHIGAFVRHAPPAQRAAFWRVVGSTLLDRLDDRPVWLNTAGAGVAWLHLRLDNRPKYYHHAPYRRIDPTRRGWC